MSGRIFTLLLAVLLSGSALAQTLAVYPFETRDTFLGALVADRVSEALEEQFEVYGPAVAPSLVPPLPVSGGFINPTEFLASSGVANRTGAALLRDSLGATAVLTGSIGLEEDRLRGRFFLAREGEVESLTLTSPTNDPSRLANGLARSVARRLGHDVSPRISIDMSGGDSEVAQAITLIAAGLGRDARTVLENIADPGERALELLEALRQFEEGSQQGDLALMATLAVNRQPLDEPLALRYFQLLSDRSELPAAHLWTAVLETSLNDLSAAREHFEALPDDFEYGQAARAAFIGRVDGELPEETAGELLESEGVATLLGLASIAQEQGATELEKDALARLGRIAPFFSYPFERLSFIAFDEEEPLAAAQALAVAVELEPQSDLYWTNLGWAYYLLGMLDESESASREALSHDPSQYIARYNLGLVLSVTGRLEEASSEYLEALRIDPEVDDAAIEDLEQALELYPRQAAVHYSLAMLYEAEGRRGEAAQQYQLFADAASEGSFRARALERVEVLTAPPPPIELTDGLVTLGLGSRQIEAPPYHPGDPLYPSFEVYTPGEELPSTLDVDLQLVGPQGEIVVSGAQEVQVPQGAIGLVIDEVEVTLPPDLPAGAYRLDVDVRATEGREASGSVMFEVAGEPQLLRQLLGRNLEMQSLETGSRLYETEDLANPGLLVDVLLRELLAGAEIAEQALPEVEAGRFEGMGGGQIFESSTAEDVRDFLHYLLASGARDTSFVFAEAYAQWAVEGAPLAPEGQ